jgi:hypothetical protein
MLRRLGRDERGNVLVIFATALPVMILIAALVLDVGNWYAHKRKLQSRVDDAVFAAALEYGYRFPECTSDPAGAGAQAIVASARRFAGDESVADPVNTGVNQPAPATTFDVNDPCVLNTTGDTVSPDGGYWLQMDGAETNVVSLFGGFGVPVPRIAAQARVALMRPETLTGVQPFAVADAALTECAWVRFRNNGGLQDSIQLTRQPGTNTWTGTDAVNEDGTFLAADVELGSCDNSARRVTYENVGYVDNYPTEVENTTVFQVVLSGSPCNGSYLYREGGNCTIGISANVVFPCAPPPGGGDPVRLVYASLGEPGDREILLTPDGDPDGTQPDWWTGQWANVAPGSGALDVTLRRACNGSFLPLGKQQAVMAGDDGQEGPIADFTLSTTTFTGSTAGTFSETATLVLDPLTSDEPDSLRVPIRGAIPTPGSFLSGAVACGPAGPSSVADAVAEGCADERAPGDTLTVMSAGASGTGALASAYQSAWCASPNNWSDYPGIPRGDPRLITVAVTAPGAPFSQAGGVGNTQTITRFAAFYVTGWDGQSGCSGNDPEPPAIVGGGAVIWGHFVKFALPPSDGTPSSEPCTWIGESSPGRRDDVEACVAALVR